MHQGTMNSAQDVSRDHKWGGLSSNTMAHNDVKAPVALRPHCRASARVNGPPKQHTLWPQRTGRDCMCDRYWTR